jgi:O-acetyl-ADP-ribose deacetylase (regulator of RNase III)
MKIIYVNGNLLDCSESILIHGTNAQGKFASGVAGQIRTRYPEAYTAYMKTYVTDGLQLGLIIPAISGEKLILNAITQEFYGYNNQTYVNYPALISIFNQLNKIFNKDDRIAMPMIGAGLGGGDWNRIEEIIEISAVNYQPVVYQL